MSSSNDCGPPEARGSDDDLQGLEILLVEDLQSAADALKQHLKLLGAQVTGSAATIAEATKLIIERLPHAAFVDFHLRGGDSSGLIAQLCEKGVPVIMLSGSFEFEPPLKALFGHSDRPSGKHRPIRLYGSAAEVSIAVPMTASGPSASFPALWPNVCFTPQKPTSDNLA